MKTTFNRRQLQNIKSGISRQPFIGSYSNVKHKPRWPNHILQILKMKTPQMEDNLKIQKVEYLINYVLTHKQISNISLDDQTIFYKSLKWRRPQMEDNLKILKLEYIINILWDHTQILKIVLDDQPKFTYDDKLQRKMKYCKWNASADWIILKFSLENRSNQIC